MTRFLALACILVALAATSFQPVFANSRTDPLPSWNEGAAKQAPACATMAAYGPADGLPAITVGTFSQEMYDLARSEGWVVVSMKNDWKRIFTFDELSLERERDHRAEWN
jgi:hypothetical protein